MNKKEQAKALVMQHFPKCPICKSDAGYEISGFFANKFQCVSCGTRWHSKDLPKKFNNDSKMVLERISQMERANWLLGDKGILVSAWKNWEEEMDKIELSGCQAYEQAILPALSLSDSRASLKENEKVIDFWEGQKLEAGMDSFGNRTINKLRGQLVLTSERLMWISGTSFIFDIPLEQINSIAICKVDGEPALNVRSFIDVFLKLWKGRDECMYYVGPGTLLIVKETILKSVETKKELISKTLARMQARDKVQVILDFSTLKEVMKTGGLVMTTFKCPSCSANLDFPESGNILKCKYCDAIIKPVDIFEKIKSLIE